MPPSFPTVPSNWTRLLIAGLLCCACGIALARGDDHEQARAALQAGEILPLPVLLERVAREQPGQVLEVELERDHEDGRWLYELKLLQPEGRVVKLKVDARTGAVLPRRGGR